MSLYFHLTTSFPDVSVVHWPIIFFSGHGLSYKVFRLTPYRGILSGYHSLYLYLEPNVSAHIIWFYTAWDCSATEKKIAYVQLECLLSCFCKIFFYFQCINVIIMLTNTDFHGSPYDTWNLVLSHQFLLTSTMLMKIQFYLRLEDTLHKEGNSSSGNIIIINQEV